MQWKRLAVWAAILALVANLWPLSRGPVPVQAAGLAPILLVVNSSFGANPFGGYLAEILRAEGLNAFERVELDTLTAGGLAARPVVILAETPLTAAQAALFTDYVNAGGRLIAMRPDSQLAGLFGLGAAAGVLTDGWLKLDTDQSEAAGLTSAPLQIHGAADQWTPAAGTVVAQLHSTRTAATPYPAVITGPSGRAVAFTYDLARNVVLTRQGNPALADVDTDGDGVLRTIDLFQGAGGSTPWVDRDTLPVPQADMQMRLFARLVQVQASASQPLPQLWYFPGAAKTMLILTGDAHANILAQYDQLLNSVTAAGGRITLYLSQGGDLAGNAAYVQARQAQGHTFGIHPYGPPTFPTLAAGYQNYAAWFTTAYSTPPSRTVRNHQVAWQGWTTAADVVANAGFALDTDFYVWGAWLRRPDLTWPHGYLTGSGQPMLFARSDGTLVPVFQQLTQLIDEQLLTGAGDALEGLNASQATAVSRTLIDASLAGDYAALMAQLHVDYYGGAVQTWAENTLAYAQANGVPIWNADRWLAFTEIRHAAEFQNLAWEAGTRTLTFDLAAGADPGLTLTPYLPLTYAGWALSTVTVDGAPAAFSTQVLNGQSAAFVNVPAGPHTFTAVYNAALPQPPTLTALTPPALSVGVPPTTTVTAQFSEPLDPATVTAAAFELHDPAALPVPAAVSFSAGTNTATLIPSAPLSPHTAYTAIVHGDGAGVRNLAGVALAADAVWTFTTGDYLCPCTLWEAGAAPAVPQANDGAPIETGVRFRAGVAGQITGLRVYRGAAGAGTYTASLWTNAGVLVAASDSQTVSGSGWQTLTFPAPVPIQADLTYVASVFNPAGDYAYTGSYFAGAGWDRAPLRALANGEDGPNGVYRLGSAGFPTQSAGANYWVDVVFALPSVDTTAPLISGLAAVPGPAGTAQLTWTTDEPATTRVDYGTAPGPLTQTVTTAGLSLAHTLALTGLAPETAYTYQVTASDSAGNTATASGTFTTLGPSELDTTAADFAAGTLGGCVPAPAGAGALTLAPARDDSFAGAALPAGWTALPWQAGGSAAVGGGQLSVNGARAGTTTAYPAGRALEFTATFGAAAFQHAGLAADLDFSSANWAIFSTFTSTSTLYARVSRNGTESTFALPGHWLGAPHRYRIEWTDAQVAFYIDGTLQSTSSLVPAGDLLPVFSDAQADSVSLSAAWARLTPYAAACTFASRVFDAGAAVNWGTLTWSAEAPAGTSVALRYRLGATPTPDASWTAFMPVPASGAALAGHARYLQYAADLSTTDTLQTPALTEVVIAYTFGPDTVPPAVALRTPAAEAVGVPPDAPIVITFSEPMAGGSFTGGALRLHLVGVAGEAAGTVTVNGRDAVFTPTVPLAAGLVYEAQLAGTVTDLAGNTLGVGTAWTFTVAPELTALADTTAADFAQGELGLCRAAALAGDGEVTLPALLDEPFPDASWPAGWSSQLWAPPFGAAQVTGGALSLAGASAGTDAAFSAGRALEFTATFGAAAFQHAGLAGDLTFTAPAWAMFSTAGTTTQLYARVNTGGSAIDVPLAGSWLGAPHRYRIVWNSAAVAFFIDGAQVATAPFAPAGPLHIVASAYAAGGPALSVAAVRLTPYGAACTFTGRVLDAGAAVHWQALTWSGSQPAGTAVSLAARAGDTPLPDETWTAWTPVSGPLALADHRYLQYQATLTTTDPDQAPVLAQVIAQYHQPAAQLVRLDLQAGWNLVSVPVAPVSSNLSDLLAGLAGRIDLVYAYLGCSDTWLKYDATAPAYVNTLTTLDHRHGFWIRLDAPATLLVQGQAPASTTLDLCAGWNLVGYPAADTRPVPAALGGVPVDLIYSYSAPADAWQKYAEGAPAYVNTLTDLQPQRGYWIHLTAPAAWTVPR